MPTSPPVLSVPAAPRINPWICIAINLLAFPGLGTVLARRRFGYVQAAIMVAGFLLVVGYFGWIFLGLWDFIRTADETAWYARWRAGAWAGLTGLGLVALAWCAALLSSIRIGLDAMKVPDVPVGRS